MRMRIGIRRLSNFGAVRKKDGNDPKKFASSESRSIFKIILY
jgi:hypothetical protein